MPIKKVVVLGPESTGKSSLCEQLAVYFSAQCRTDWVPEYAREWLLTHGKEYSYDDLLVIAKQQLALEDEKSRQMEKAGGVGTRKEAPGEGDQGSLLFIDTDMYVMKVWCEFVFGKCHPWILEQISARKYDYYLLCNTDLPWVEDELREYPDLATREKLFRIYKDSMINQSVPWSEIRGTEDLRVKMAIEAVSRLLF
jgi:NadR type nicotinamide-nucleotide adenylyltransferase